MPDNHLESIAASKFAGGGFVPFSAGLVTMTSNLVTMTRRPPLFCQLQRRRRTGVLHRARGQFAEFAGAKTVAVGDQDCGRVAVPIPGILPGGILETVHLLWGQIFPLPQIGVRRPARRNCPIYDG